MRTVACGSAFICFVLFTFAISHSICELVLDDFIALNINYWLFDR